LVLAGFGTSSARAGYVVVDLGVLSGGSQSAGLAINAKGVVAGWGNTSQGYNQAVRSLNGSLADLGTLGGHQSWAYSINTGGRIAGVSEVSYAGHPGQFIWHAFETGPNGAGMQDLGTLKGMISSAAFAVNSSGNATGYSGSPFATHAFRTNSAGGLTDLGTLAGGTYSRGNAINDSGDVAGTARTSWGSYHAFRYTDVGGMKDLGTLPLGSSSYGLAINRWDQVAGEADDAAGDFHAFYTNGKGQLVDIGTLTGGTSSVALGLNDSGVVVGSSSTIIVGGQVESHGFIYDTKHGLVDLNSLINPKAGWDITEADSINAMGQITGMGTVNGQSHAFILTPSGGTAPTPEPASSVLLLLGILCAVACRNHRNTETSK
jgi:probable HAF family extracellular repeat protein